ncbi:MAG TPA: ABC transporter permease [Gemmatimonadaceae bacterium]|nr:ABC transporter permease [Gemmatimonadaceae bacterium]
MRHIAKALRRLRVFLAPRRFERELDEELSFHLEMQTRWHESHGLDRASARALAAREFGGETRFKEAVRDVRGLSWSHDVARDVRFALRSYGRSPGFTAVALLTLALGIGTTTATFSIVDAVLFRPLPYGEPDRIVTLSSQDSLGNRIRSVSAPNFYDWQEQSRSFEAMALFSAERRAVVAGGNAAYIETATVSVDFFCVIGVPARIGRTIQASDVEASERVVVVSHGFWARALGSPSALPESPLEIDGERYRVVGVLPLGREYPAGVDLFVPHAFGQPWRTASRNNINFNVIARLAHGVTLERARSDMRAIASRLHRAHPEDLYAYGAPVTLLRDHIVGSARLYLELLAGAVGMVLLVACANLANANLARGATRTRELAIRTALGAGRMRLVRQLLVESVVLAVVGGAAGVALAWGFVRAIGVATTVDLPRVDEIGLHGSAVIFALLLSIVVGIAVGVAPAVQVRRSALSQSLASGGRATPNRSRAAARDVLIGVELALAIVLLVGAGLLIRSFSAVVSRDLGFVANDAISAEVSLPAAKYTDQRAIAFYDELVPSLRTIPGVTAVGATNALPLGSSATGFIEIEGQGDVGAGAGYRVVSEDYFAAMGIPLELGRVFDATDGPFTPRVTIVNRRMAERFWPGEDPIGKRVKAKSMEWKNTPWLTVIGVVGDVRHWGLEREPVVEHYVLHRQRPEFTRDMAVVVRAAVPARQIMPAVRERVRAIDADVPVALRTLEARVDESLAERRFIMTVLGAFGTLALVLAAVGVYGVLSFTVAQRTREIAVRMALGAERRRVLGLVVGHALRVSVIAAVVGVIVARAMSRLMTALLFDVSPADPRTYAAVTGLLLIVAVVAAYVPARKAAAVDPMLVLRSE